MGFMIYNYEMKEITGNFTLKDNDYIDYTLPSSGTYYIKVYGDNSGNTYNLFWETLEVNRDKTLLSVYLFFLFGGLIGVSMLLILKYFDRIAKVR